MQTSFISSPSAFKPVLIKTYSSTHNKRCHQSNRLSLRCSAQQEEPNAPATCPTCGVPKSEMSMGCDGSGRIMGGIGAVPGFGWWPIKAYRPCGKATAAGITYKRKGQVVDEVLFGRNDTQ